MKKKIKKPMSSVEQVCEIIKSQFEKVTTKQQALDFLVKAGIYTKKGNLKKPYRSK